MLSLTLALLVAVSLTWLPLVVVPDSSGCLVLEVALLVVALLVHVVALVVADSLVCWVTSRGAYFKTKFQF